MFTTVGDEVNLDTYHQRMSSALPDKMRILDHVVGEHVADIGCGGGDLLVALSDRGKTAYGFDPSAESLRRAEVLAEDTGADLSLFCAYADELVDHVGEKSLDTVLCSSVLHEIYSYGNAGERRADMQSIRDSLRAFSAVLRSGGRLVVRDGMHPGEGRGTIWVDDREAVHRFLAESPYSARRVGGSVSDEVALDLQETTVCGNDGSRHGYFIGDLSSLMEFSFTYNWGWDSWEREIREFYGVFSREHLKSLAAEHGFVCREFQSYVQRGYLMGLKDRVRYLDAEFPMTNAVWVFEKE